MVTATIAIVEKEIVGVCMNYIIFTVTSILTPL